MADPSSFTYTYDLAMRTLVYSRFGSILGMSALGSTQADRINRGVVICPKRIAQRMLSEKRGETFLDFINVYRTSMAFAWERQRSVVARRGIKVIQSDGSVKVTKANPINFQYGVWFWSNSLDKVTQCMEKYIQWWHDTAKVTLTYDGTYTLNPDIHLSPVVDESEIEDVFNTGKIWCFRMPIAVDAWVPFAGVDSQRIHKIRLTTYDKDELETYTDIVVEGSSQDTELEAALRMFRAKLFGITDVDVAAKSLTTPNDRTSDFSAGDKIQVENSTENNGMYTVVAATYDAGEEETAIVVQEALGGSTADGNIYKHEGT